jgi:hypothetical protein
MVEEVGYLYYAKIGALASESFLFSAKLAVSECLNLHISTQQKDPEKKPCILHTPHYILLLHDTEYKLFQIFWMQEREVRGTFVRSRIYLLSGNPAAASIPYLLLFDLHA